jgi:hypothetical protein
VNCSSNGRVLGVSGKTRGFIDSGANGAFGFSKGHVDGLLVAQNEGLDKFVVQEKGSIGRRWVHKPKKENAFGKIVEWNPEEKDVGEEFEETIDVAFGKAKSAVGTAVNEASGLATDAKDAAIGAAVHHGLKSE